MRIAIGIQLTFKFEMNLQKPVFKQNLTIFLDSIVSLLKSC